MKAEDVKQEISQRTGIPVHLLTGETPEEDIVRAKALLAFKRNNRQEEPKSTSQQFAEWFSAQSGEDPAEDESMQALKAYEEELRLASGGYPNMKDGGENLTIAGQDGRSTREQFAAWFGQKAAYNPKKTDGWETMF